MQRCAPLSCLVTGILVGVWIEAGLAQQGRIVGLNHVAVSVADYKGAVEFYGRQMGFREAFSFREPDGSPYLYRVFKSTANTFVEVMQATPEKPAGCPHFGLEVDHLDSAIEQLKQRGVRVHREIPSHRAPVPGSPSHPGPGGVNMELLEFGPQSLHRKVMDAWKVERTQEARVVPKPAVE